MSTYSTRIFTLFLSLWFISMAVIASDDFTLPILSNDEGDEGLSELILVGQEEQTASPQEWIPIAEREAYREGELYVKLYDDSRAIDATLFGADGYLSAKSPFAHLLELYGISYIDRAFPRLAPRMDPYLRVRFEGGGAQAEALIAALEQIRFVELAERVPRHYTFYTPNDIHPNQYNVLTTFAEDAWDLTFGSANVVIGMVDDAVLTTHEDLAPNIWVNPGEIAGNGVDDDGNGYIDDINGWDPASNDNDPNPEGTVDNFTFSHGTHCAGIAAAATDNGIGIAAPSFNVQLMAVKTANSGSGAIDAGYEGVEYAIAAGADIISMSWGGGAPADAEQAVMDMAHDMGIVLIAAAGNDNVADPMFPASYNHVISVAAIDNSDTKADFTNYGDSIDISAPGVQIWAPVATNDSAYEYYDGTSMACPYVSGVAALMLSIDPTASPDRIEECLKETADNIDDINPGFIDQLGAGRVNTFEAVKCTPSIPQAEFTASTDIPCAGETFTFLDQSAGTDLDSWNWSFPGGTPTSSTEQNPTVTYPADGVYDVTLIVGNYLGSDTLTQQITIGAPTATISGDEVILQGYIVNLAVDFTGTPPFDFTYSDGTNTYDFTGIMDDPYQIPVSPESNTTYTITSVNNAICVGTGAGVATIVVIQPDEPNDDCDNALPFPELNIAEESCVAGSTNGANGELPYINQSSCNGIDAPVPAADVWYSFVAVSNILDLTLAFTMDTAVVSIYEGTCEGLIGRGCEVSTDGNISTTFSPTTPGNTFYVQVSGGGLTDFGDFTLCIENYGETIDEICMLGQSVTVDPYPVLGAYYPEQTVEFCLFVEGYNQAAADWIHGIVPELGAGWDASTLAPTSIPPDCDGGDLWDWYDSVTGTAASAIGPVGPGFFIDLDSDGNPGNNFGDSTFGDCNWEFCFQVTTTDCPPSGDGEDLSIIFRNYSDSESGSWSSESICPDDPEYNFVAVLRCCAAPEMTGVDPLCSDTDAGEVTASPVLDFSTPPFTFDWSTGFSEVTNTTSSLTDLEAGFYTVTVTDNEGCSSVSSYTLNEVGVDLGVTTSGDTFICYGDTVEIFASGGTEYFWSPAGSMNDNTLSNPLIFPTESTEYIVVVADADGCTNYEYVSVVVLEAPPADAGPAAAVCLGESAGLSASGGTSYEWSPAATLDNPNSASPTATPTATTVYTVTVTDDWGCTATDDVTVYISPQPFFPPTSLDTTICTSDVLEIQLTDEYPLSNYEYAWSPTTGLSDPSLPNTMATITESIDYTITITNQQGCSSTQTISVNVANADIAVTATDTTITSGETAIIGVTETYEGYEWSTGETTPTISVTEAGDYIVTVSNELGCAAVDTATVEVLLLDPQYVVPTGFSPNYDGVNDVFQIVHDDKIEEANFAVYDRWGQLVFQTTDSVKAWDGMRDGKAADMGVYVIRGTLRIIDGSIIELKGNVTLLR